MTAREIYRMWRNQRLTFPHKYGAHVRITHGA